MGQMETHLFQDIWETFGPLLMVFFIPGVITFAVVAAIIAALIIGEFHKGGK